jgi:hypothetical protein
VRQHRGERRDRERANAKFHESLPQALSGLNNHIQTAL